MPPRFLTHGPLDVVGIAVTTTDPDETSPSRARVPGLWQTFFSEAVANEIPNRRDDGTVMGVCYDYEPNRSGRFTFLVGQRVADLNEVPEHLKSVTVPHGRYALFSSDHDSPAAVTALWREAENYFATPGAQRRAFTSDLEVHRAGTVELYVAVE